MLKRTLLALVLALGVFSLNGSLALAQNDSETVTATISVQSISLTVTPDSIDYGTVPFDDFRKSTDVGITFTAENTGNVNEAFMVKGSPAAGTDDAGSFNWTLVAALGCPSILNQFRHSVAPVGGPGIFLDATSSQTLVASVGPSLTQDFTSEFYTPCFGSRGSGVAVTTNIIVTAVAS